MTKCALCEEQLAIVEELVKGEDGSYHVNCLLTGFEGLVKVVATVSRISLVALANVAKET